MFLGILKGLGIMRLSMNTRSFWKLNHLLAWALSAQLGILAVAWGPTAWGAQPPCFCGSLCAALPRPPLVQITFGVVEVKLSSAIVALESLKLSGISDGDGDDDVIDHSDAFV